ncbi:hypothetical protein [Amycolatopsis sp. NPDC051102]|uniref:hypothetical protein n=1 Tax=Amycolatopsis sp. NPDC051102 TaxID=3155163 RepID=UPI00343F709A
MTHWFPYEEDEETPGLSGDETAFLEALREAAGSRAERGETEPSLLAVVSLVDGEAKVALATSGSMSSATGPAATSCTTS